MALSLAQLSRLAGGAALREPAPIRARASMIHSNRLRRIGRFWPIFAIVFLCHFALLVGVFFYAMSWSFVMPEAVPIHVRRHVAEIGYAVLSFPLPIVLAVFPFAVPGFFGYGVFAMVSALWACVIARLLAIRRQGRRNQDAASSL